MKLLEQKEVAGKLFWIQRQYLKTRGKWEVLPLGEKVLGYVNLDLSVQPWLQNWPTIVADQKGPISILREWGYELEHRGNSIFEAHNNYVVKKRELTDVVAIEKPLLIVGALRGSHKALCGLPKKLFYHDRFIVDTEELYSSKVILYLKPEEVTSQIEAAKIEWLRRQQLYFADKFFSASKDFGLTAIMIIGGHEEFKFEDIPQHLFELSRIKIKNTYDGRQNLTDTYKVILVNTVRLEGKTAVNLKIPEVYKPAVIGKSGIRIKASSKKLNCKIYLI